jgi:hypothetical protein
MSFKFPLSPTLDIDTRRIHNPSSSSSSGHPTVKQGLTDGREFHPHSVGPTCFGPPRIDINKALHHTVGKFMKQPPCRRALEVKMQPNLMAFDLRWQFKCWWCSWFPSMTRCNLTFCETFVRINQFLRRYGLSKNFGEKTNKMWFSGFKHVRIHTVNHHVPHVF